MSGYLCLKVATENGTKTESGQKKSQVICESICHIEWAKRKNFIRMSEFIQSQAGALNYKREREKLKRR